MAVERSTESQLKNVSAVRALGSVDISDKGISERTNKHVDAGFMQNPTSDKFITTKEKPRGIAQYPLLLLHSVGSENMKNMIKEKLESFNKGDTEILVLYKRGSSAVALCKTTTMAEVGELLTDFCLEYSYYIDKGVTQEINFAKHFDFTTLTEDIIENYEDMPTIDSTKEFKVDANLEATLNKALSYINEIIEMGTNTHSDLKENYLSELGLVKVNEEEEIKSIMPPKDLSSEIGVKTISSEKEYDETVTPEPVVDETKPALLSDNEVSKPQPPKPKLLGQMNVMSKTSIPTAIQPTNQDDKQTIKAFGADN